MQESNRDMINNESSFENSSFSTSQLNSCSFRLAKSDALPSIIEAQSMNTSTKNKKNSDSMNVWYLSPSGSEINQTSIY